MKNIERFVEAHLVGIEISENPRAVKLILRDVHGESFSLLAFGLHRLHVAELRETNIVDRLNLWDSSDNPDDYRDALCALVCGKGESTDPKWKPILEDAIQALREGNRVFAEVEAVYGAQILILAGSVTVSE